LATLTESNVREMGLAWYSGLDNHLPEVEMLKFLVTEGLEQRWPDWHVQSLADFEGWYQHALRTFFDEVHTLHEFNVTVSPDGSKADVKVFVNWQARIWTPIEARSQHLNLDIHQTWEVVLSPEGKPIIKFISVDGEPQPAEGSATL
jgi:uncharacterized repeat protein (TIGR02543 family)